MAPEESESPANTPDDRQVNDVTYREIGETLALLGARLRDIGTYTDDEELRTYLVYADDDLTPAGEDPKRAELDKRLRRTLSELSNFRRDYAKWERIIVEFALTKYGMTQRDVARLLGVGLSTVNRWAQNPVTYDED